MRLTDKVILVIGAGEHLGRSAPLLFAQEGAKVVIVARREHVLKETTEMIRSHGGEVEYFVGSAADAKSAQEMVDIVIDDVAEFAGGAELSDDITVVVIRSMDDV